MPPCKIKHVANRKAHVGNKNARNHQDFPEPQKLHWFAEKRASDQGRTEQNDC